MIPTLEEGISLTLMILVAPTAISVLTMVGTYLKARREADREREMICEAFQIKSAFDGARENAVSAPAENKTERTEPMSTRKPILLWMPSPLAYFWIFLFSSCVMLGVDFVLSATTDIELGWWVYPIAVVPTAAVGMLVHHRKVNLVRNAVIEQQNQQLALEAEGARESFDWQHELWMADPGQYVRRVGEGTLQEWREEREIEKKQREAEKKSMAQLVSEIEDLIAETAADAVVADHAREELKGLTERGDKNMLFSFKFRLEAEVRKQRREKLHRVNQAQKLESKSPGSKYCERCETKTLPVAGMRENCSRCGWIYGRSVRQALAPHKVGDDVALESVELAQKRIQKQLSEAQDSKNQASLANLRAKLDSLDKMAEEIRKEVGVKPLRGIEAVQSPPNTLCRCEMCGVDRRRSEMQSIRTVGKGHRVFVVCSDTCALEAHWR